MKLRTIFTLTILLFVINAFSQNNKIIDKRALSYYTKDEINNMPLYKVMQLNYDFNDSYIIPVEMKRKVNKKKIDVLKFSNLRNKNTETKVDIGSIDEKSTGLFIILKSQVEVSKAHQEIKNKYLNK